MYISHTQTPYPVKKRLLSVFLGCADSCLSGGGGGGHEQKACFCLWTPHAEFTQTYVTNDRITSGDN